MSQRQNKEDRRSVARNLAVTSKCLAIVLLPQKKQQAARFDCDAVSSDQGVGAGAGYTGGSGNTLPKQSSATTTQSSSSRCAQANGKDILDDFKQQNKTCYWNPALIESIKQLEYLGFVEPCTVLVGGEDIHLENLRSAWGRRVLKPPGNYTIERIGDVNGIEMQVIPQTQFIPLPDSLCLIITELNNASQPATLESIRTRLQRWYHNTSLPSQQLIYDTLGALIRERKVFHNGTSYCVVTPETYHLPTANPSLACTASWLPYHPMYIPVFPHPHPPPQHQSHPSVRAPTRSISCQVTHIEDKLSSEGSQRPPKPRLRSHSVRACRGKDKAAVFGDDTTLDFKRAASVKYKAEKAKGMTKDLNLKSSNINQEKDKGEKVSLFSKIFGRKKKKHTEAGTATSTSSGGGNQSTEVEYATFSAQFPPPEWVWYQQQLERQKRTEEWVSQQMLKSATWQHFGPPVSGSVDSATLSRARTESLQNQLLHPATIYTAAKSHIYATLSTVGPGQSIAMDGGFRGLSEGSGTGSRGVNEKRSEEEAHQRQMNYATVSQAKKGHGHGHHHRHHHGHHKQKDHRKAVHENNYDVPGSNLPVQGGASGNARVDNMEEDNIYCSPSPVQQASTLPWHSTPYYDVPPPQMDSQLMPSNIICNSTLQTKMLDSGKLYANPSHRRSHRPRQRGHKAYSCYDTTVGNDISIEYKGRLPKKNSHVAQSRDSGVNCVGIYKSHQHSLSKRSHPTMQECSPYGAIEVVHPVTGTTISTTSTDHPEVMSVQRGTPYTSMEQRSPEGCSEHHPIINILSPSINNPPITGTDRYRQLVSGNSFSADNHNGRLLEDRLECEGYSQDGTPSFVAMTYCDSSVGEEGAGGGEVILCQAEINHRQVPQLVLDTELRDRSTLAEEPDVALSSAGSRDTLERTAGESERSSQTVVVHSPDSFADGRSKMSSRMTDSAGDSKPLSYASQVARDGSGEAKVTRLGSELQELGVVDSGFNSPRNSDDKENQQQQTARLPQADIGPRRDQIGARQQCQELVSPQDEIPNSENKSKHERIKAFVKQSNQMLEQRQLTSPASSQAYASDPQGSYTTHSQSGSQPHSNLHYSTLPKPLHPIQHPHIQQQPPAALNNQRHHHHGRPHSMHGIIYERPRAQSLWAAGEVSPPRDLHTFQQQQLSGRKFGLNGEFEVVGVV